MLPYSYEPIYLRKAISAFCPPLQIDHGSIRPDGRIPAGVTVSVSCDVGFKLTTYYRAVCLNSSLYDVGQPACIPITVGKLRSSTIIVTHKVTCLYSSLVTFT